MAYAEKEKQKAYQRDWQRKQRLKRKIKVIEMLGGCCKHCGYNENMYAFNLDHIKPLKRDENNKSHISKTTGSNLWRNVSNGRIPKTEVQLLCANCHAIKTHEKDRPTFNNYL